VAAYSRGSLEEAERLWTEALALEPGWDRPRAYLSQLRGHAPARSEPPAPAAAAEPAAPVAEAVPVEPAVARAPEEPVAEAPPVAPVAEAESHPTPPAPPPATHAAPPGAKAQGPGRFSVPPERLAAARRRRPARATRKPLLVAALAVAVVAAVAAFAAFAWRPGAGSPAGEARPIAAVRRAAVEVGKALAALPGEAASLVAQLREGRRSDPAAPGPDASPPLASGQPQEGGTQRRHRPPAPVNTPQPEPAARAEGSTLSRAALGTRWGMTLDELLAALPSATRLAQPERLGEGDLVVQARAERVDLGGHAYRADFSFDGSGRLAAIQLRSIPSTGGEAVYEGLQRALTTELGEPTAEWPRPAGKGEWVARSSWSASRAVVDLEIRRLAPGAAAVLVVDIRGGSLQPLDRSQIVLTLASPHDAGSRPAASP
jgi:hypothetical protein